MLIVAVLLVTVGMRFVMVGVALYYLLPRGPTCPRCRRETLPIRSAMLDWIRPRVQRRWCFDCGWDGVMRARPAVPAPPSHPPARRPLTPA